MLGRLARYLRIMGYSTKYSVEEDEKILEGLGDCILLTRDKGLCSKAGPNCVYISSGDLKEQLAQLRLEIGLPLRLPERPLRCSVCNGPLEYVGKVGDRELWRCKVCGQPYWMGSHIKRIKRTLEEVNKTLGFT
ncbi:TPA: hypothetical protein HA337_05265 [Desulfurococcaceae archaeon]|nr:hypothetical protein [Desulfurococcaceae archaeon]